ncbi:Cobalt-zinc-cadmium resistance protein CzcA; Cation efflux system protein CusA [plant metagenome]|uniref:Cobalt-zinc-cadmium resistance protein CzcA Cation efflux system protein CusA n=1 Tax=plant metagenome TaxID=1297885 RepID=A0A484S4K9_9ZZZZ
MWIVRYALSRPYTIAVIALLILIFGIRATQRMPTDILPEVGIPSVNLLWTYGGLPASEMAAKITSQSEISILNNVDDLREVRSETMAGIGIVRVEFQPHVNLERALAQITAVSQTILRRMPQGTVPPLVVRNNVSSTPVLQLVLASDSLTEAQLYDYARLQLRAQIQSIPGIRMTLPYGGAPRQIMVDLDPQALHVQRLTPQDVTAALQRGSPTLPAGSLREGQRELQVALNTSPADVRAFLDLPIAERGGNVILLRDVASVRDGAALQSSMARVDGGSAVSVSLIKLGGASAVDIVQGVRERLPEIIASAPPGTRIEPIFDQSVFVENAVGAVMHEAMLVGVLIGLVVLLFLGSWRSSLIVLVNIPLALLASLTVLHLLGHTLNVMSLGGLALAIGILVDNAVVDIENTNRHIALGKDVRTAILDNAREVVFPEFVSTVSVCIVLTPILLMTGLSAWVFTPLALAVIFALLASFVLSAHADPHAVLDAAARGHPQSHCARSHGAWSALRASCDRETPGGATWKSRTSAAPAEAPAFVGDGPGVRTDARCGAAGGTAHGTRVFSAGGCRPDSFAGPLAHRHAHRRKRTLAFASAAGDPLGHSGRGTAKLLRADRHTRSDQSRVCR